MPRPRRQQRLDPLPHPIRHTPTIVSGNQTHHTLPHRSVSTRADFAVRPEVPSYRDRFLTTLPAEAVDAAVARGTAADVRFVAFAGCGEDAWQDLYESFVPLHNATPDAAGGREPPPLSTLQHGYPEPWQILLVRRDDAIVGLTMAFARPDMVSRVVTFFTGVVENERGQGIATALKAEHARRLADAGWRELTTWNMESNIAILTINARLGFAPLTRMQALTYDFEATQA
jgi:GNAT superfamily N-acetyltransferase